MLSLPITDPRAPLRPPASVKRDGGPDVDCATLHAKLDAVLANQAKKTPETEWAEWEFKKKEAEDAFAYCLFAIFVLFGLVLLVIGLERWATTGTFTVVYHGPTPSPTPFPTSY